MGQTLLPIQVTYTTTHGDQQYGPFTSYLHSNPSLLSPFGTSFPWFPHILPVPHNTANQSPLTKTAPDTNPHTAGEESLSPQSPQYNVLLPPAPARGSRTVPGSPSPQCLRPMSLLSTLRCFLSAPTSRLAAEYEGLWSFAWTEVVRFLVPVLYL